MRASEGDAPARIPDLPSALEEVERVLERARGGEPAVFLDYDGTLTPIVDDPEAARLPDSTRRVLARLATRCPVAVISGRDLDDVRRRVGLQEIFYAGSHGFDVLYPDGRRRRRGGGFRDDLRRAARRLASLEEDVPGTRVERKAFAVAVHYRRAPAGAGETVEERVREVLRRHPGLRATGGKKIVELRPDVGWDKGETVLHLLDEMELDPDAAVPVYVGDDVTDEDAFRAVRSSGIGIAVRGEGDDRPTRARLSLAGPDEVRAFLAELSSALAEGTPDRDGAEA